MDAIHQLVNANVGINLHAILRHQHLYVTILEGQQPSADADYLSILSHHLARSQIQVAILKMQRVRYFQNSCIV